MCIQMLVTHICLVIVYSRLADCIFPLSMKRRFTNARIGTSNAQTFFTNLEKRLSIARLKSMEINRFYRYF